MTASDLVSPLRGSIVVFALATVAAIGTHFDGSAMRSFDGSVFVHHAGTFELTDDTGRRSTIGPAANGTIVLMGFTHCKDACPLALARIGASLAAVPKELRPEAFFVSIDPRDDTPAALHRYLRPWRGLIVGASADATTLERLASALGTGRIEPDYGNHDSGVFFIDASGDVVRGLR